MCDELLFDPSCKRCGGTGVVLKPNGEPPDECDCKRDWQPDDDALSCSAPLAGSVFAWNEDIDAAFLRQNSQRLKR